MRDPSAGRASGQTQAAVFAMVRALRITVLKSAGDFTRDECHDLSAENLRRVKCFCWRARNSSRASNFRASAGAAGFINFRLWSVGLTWSPLDLNPPALAHPSSKLRLQDLAIVVLRKCVDHD